MAAGLTGCNVCGNLVARNAAACPKCGAHLRRSRSKARALPGILIFLAGLTWFVISILEGGVANWFATGLMLRPFARRVSRCSQEVIMGIQLIELEFVARGLAAAARQSGEVSTELLAITDRVVAEIGSHKNPTGAGEEVYGAFGSSHRTRTVPDRPITS